MAASIALGVAVDDTIHYLTWYREGLNTLRDRHKAIDYAYRRCAAPTLQAALISGLGLAVFTLSTFTPTQRMGWLMMTILIAGVVAELVMMPAILAGPLGKAFKVPPSAPIAPVPAPHLQRRKTQLASSRT
jgi:predicted RND superfamily exporter protein